MNPVGLLRRFLRRRRRPGAPNVKFGSVIRNTTFGDYCYVGPQCRIFHCDIGAFASLGPQVVIGENEHILDYDFLSTSLLSSAEQEAYCADIQQRTALGADCWICARAVIRKGVRIGHGAVVGAGAVVVRDVPPYAIVGGVPARLIRMRLDAARRAELEASRWWEMKPAQLVAQRVETGHSAVAKGRGKA